MEQLAMNTNWKQQLRALKIQHIKCTSPGFYELSGGDRMKLKAWNDTTANGLTDCVIDWITYKGGSATRIICTGQYRKINGSMKWVPGSTRNGTADIHACINGRHCSIEVKIGRDRMSEDQHKEKARIEAAGGLYVIATDMPSFIFWHSKTFPNV